MSLSHWGDAEENGGSSTQNDGNIPSKFYIKRILIFAGDTSVGPSILDNMSDGSGSSQESSDGNDKYNRLNAKIGQLVKRYTESERHREEAEKKTRQREQEIRGLQAELQSMRDRLQGIRPPPEVSTSSKF